MDQELRNKVAKLPTWARDLIKRLEGLPGNLADECASLRKKVDALESNRRKLEDRCDAMVQLFQSAAVGGNDFAKTVVRVLEDYDIYKPDEHLPQ